VPSSYVDHAVTAQAVGLLLIAGEVLDGGDDLFALGT
jgi:hypothetical protein